MYLMFTYMPEMPGFIQISELGITLSPLGVFKLRKNHFITIIYYFCNSVKFQLPYMVVWPIRFYGALQKISLQNNVRLHLEEGHLTD